MIFFRFLCYGFKFDATPKTIAFLRKVDKSPLLLHVNLPKLTFVRIFAFLLLSIVHAGCTTDKKPIAFMDPYPKPVFEQISDTITRNLKENIKRIIVLTFINQDGKEHKLGSVFAEKLTTELVKQNKLIVLDRMVFKSKLQEKSLSLIGNPDLNYLKQVGEILGVDAVVIGIVNPYATGYDLNCRLIDVKTGLILSAEEGYYSEKTD